MTDIFQLDHILDGPKTWHSYKSFAVFKNVLRRQSTLLFGDLPKSNPKLPCDYDRDLYKERHLIDNFFAKLKQVRAIATRATKTQKFLAGIHIAFTVVGSQPQ